MKMTAGKLVRAGRHELDQHLHDDICAYNKQKDEVESSKQMSRWELQEKPLTRVAKARGKAQEAWNKEDCRTMCS